MRSAWIRVGRVVLVFGLSGWLTGVLLLSTNDDVSIVGAVSSGTPIQCLAAGVVISAIFAPLLAWLRPPIWSGLLVGPLASATGIYTFFWLWPHSWQPSRWEAWKSTGVVADSYWEYLLPGALASGLLVAWWIRQAVAPTALEEETQRLAELETRKLAELESRKKDTLPESKCDDADDPDEAPTEQIEPG